MFENASKDNPDMGDGAYLFDPQGDVRASMIYPCRVGCANPAQGQIALGTQPRKDEYISLTNTGGAPIDLEPYVLKTPPYSYAFPQGTVLGPGQTIRVHTQGDPAEDTATDQLLGHDEPDPRQQRRRRRRSSTYSDIEIACTAYGSKSC